MLIGAVQALRKKSGGHWDNIFFKISLKFNTCKPIFSFSVVTSWYLYLNSARLSYSYLSTLLLWAVLCWQFLPYVQRPSRPFLSHKSSCNAAPAAAVAAAAAAIAAASHWCGRKSLANKKNKSQIASNRIELNRYCGCCPIVPSLPQRVFRSGDLTNYATQAQPQQLCNGDSNLLPSHQWKSMSCHTSSPRAFS